MAKIRLDSAGIGALLVSSEVAKVINRLGESIAANVDPPLPHSGAVKVDVTPRTATTLGRSPRAAVDVTLVHPSMPALEAKYGTLTRAAASAGLEVTEQTP